MRTVVKRKAVFPKTYPATVKATLNKVRKVVSHFNYSKNNPENRSTIGEVMKRFELLMEKFLD